MERFHSKYEGAGSHRCWNWKAGKYPNGYGSFATIRDKSEGAHRVAWRLSNGEPGDMHVLHKCDNKRCVNPAHLFIGTPADNNADRASKGRSADIRGEKHPMCKLTESDVMAIRSIRKNGKTLKEIASMFGISHSNVSMICNRVNWRHI